ncbi:MAG: PVC-type heme-binding CxxCH protein, partial [Pirellulaceae bacterium]
MGTPENGVSTDSFYRGNYNKSPAWIRLGIHYSMAHFQHSGFMIRNSLAILILTGNLLLVTHSSHAQEPKLELRQGDTICIIGNTLAERMQHDGVLEAAIQQYFPDLQLTFRNLGFSGDTLTTRLRSKDFGTPDEWLTRCEADVVFAFFGYNESFAGEEGLPQFREQLDQFVKNTLQQKYNGESAPRLVLFSPTARENLNDKPAVIQGAVDGLETVNQNVPDGRDHEELLWSYTRAMQEVAEQNDVLFVNLMEFTGPFFNHNKDEQFTINGVHLNDRGNTTVAIIVLTDLLGVSRLKSSIDELHEAVIDKNWYWFHRYRTTDGYSTYGGRADLQFTDGQTNREVVQRELEVLDYMTAERDKKIWAIASGSDYTPNDSDHPPFIPVISNKPGEGPDGKHLFLSGEESIATMTVHDGMQVNLFASEEQFPELASPVQMSFDPKGRLWVAVWPTYPHWQPIVEEMNDKLVIFTDTDGDGRADDVTVFADKLHNPTGFEFWNGGVLVAQAPDVWFLKDTDGDDVADLRLRVLHGIDSADTHHTANSFTYGPDGAMYFQEGTFHHSQIESPWGPPLKLVNGGVFRFEPRTHKIEAYVSYPFANPHGHVFDHWGQDFVTDGTGNVNYYAAPFSGHIEHPNKHRNYFPFFQQWVRPSGATELLSSQHFPEQFQGNYLIANVIGFQGLLHYEVNEDESGFSATEVTPILSSTDPNFRPVDIEMGPDGAIYFVDWQNPIIGHMQHNLRDPNRDKAHGRVYRVTWKDGELSTPVDLSGLTTAQLLDQLKSPVNRVRYRTRLELSGRDSDEVIAAVRQWVPALDSSDAEYQHHLLEALWTTRQHNRVNVDLLKQVLQSPEPRARAAATRVLCYSRDQVPDVLSLLKQQVNDEFPRVRLEAVRALSFFPSVEAAEIALEALKYPNDKFIDYCLGETMRVLAPMWKPHVASGIAFAEDNTEGLRYIIADLSPAELTGMRRSQTVFEELLKREGVLHEFRHEAAEGLAKINGTDANIELLSAITRLDQSDAPNAQSVLADLTHIFLHGDGSNVHGDSPQVDFSKYRDQLDDLATSARRENTRQVAYATLIAAEKSAERLWKQTVESPERFRDFINALALVDDSQIKTQLEPKVAELLLRLPMELEQQIDAAKVTRGRYVRIELPGDQRTLTLAEVDVMSGGRNIAPGGSATQSSTNHGAGPELAIDGNK